MQHFNFTCMGSNGQHGGSGQDRTLKQFGSFQESLRLWPLGPEWVCGEAKLLD
jgi:hypothetical protein